MTGQAQQNAASRFALPSEPRIIETAQQKIRVSVVARGIPHPFSLLVLPDGDMLVSERSSGKLHAIRKGVLDPKPLTGVPAVHIGFHAGLLDLAAHPKFSENRLIYFTYHKPAAETGTYSIVLARGRLEGAGLTNVQDLWIGNTTRRSGGSRLLFAPDGTIYITTGGATGGNVMAMTATVSLRYHVAHLDRQPSRAAIASRRRFGGGVRSLD